MLKKWVPEYELSETDRQTVVGSVIQELTGGQPGDHTVLIGGDIMVFGEVDVTGFIHVYETKILRSTEDHEDQQFEGAAVVGRANNGGLVS